MSNAQNTTPSVSVTPATIAEAISAKVPTTSGPYPMPTELGEAIYMQHGDVVTISFQVVPQDDVNLSASGKSWTRFKAMTAKLGDMNLQVLGYTSVPKSQRKSG